MIIILKIGIIVFIEPNPIFEKTCCVFGDRTIENSIIMGMMMDWKIKSSNRTTTTITPGGIKQEIYGNEKSGFLLYWIRPYTHCTTLYSTVLVEVLQLVASEMFSLYVM
jgi:hypothetical protein